MDKTSGFRVVLEGESLKLFPDADRAMAYARGRVHLSWERAPDMDSLLAAGQIAEWGYGFASVAIYPPGRAA